MEDVKISIITPVLNGALYIGDNIQSILNINIPHEHIVVDGGSTDHTLAILNDYPHLIVLHQQEKTGMYGAIDMGFKFARGNYICWVNCDDRVVPSGYQQMYDYAVTNDLDFVCSDGIFDFIHEKRQRKVKGTRFSKYLLKSGIFAFSQPSVIYKRDLYFKVGGLDYAHFKICGDMELFWKFANVKEAHFGYIKVISSVFLKHGESLGDKGTQLGREEIATSNVPKVKGLSTLIHRIVRLLGI